MSSPMLITTVAVGAVSVLSTPAVRAETIGATIRGRIVAADTGQPLRRARVIIASPEANTASARNATTDPDGRYMLADIPAGKYKLSVFRSGYLPLQYGQRRPLETPRLLDVRASATIDHADFALQRMAVIDGQVSDERGQPVADALVLVMRSVYMNGRRQLAAQPSAAGFNVRTDDTGRYRVSALVPGSYVVMATSKATWTVHEPGRDIVMGFAPTFFPGTSDPSQASLVTVGYAEQKSDVSFPLGPVPTVRVSGTARDSHRQPLVGRRVGLTQVLRGAPAVGGSPGGGGGFEVANATVGPDGTFTMPHVLPGEYKLQARGPSVGPGGDDEAAAQTITVASANVDGIVLKTSAGWSVTGQIVTETGAAPSLPPSLARLVASVPDATNPRGGPPGGKTRIDDDWTFVVSDLFGSVRLRLNLPDGWAVKTVERDGRDVTDDAIEGNGGQELTGLRIIVSEHVTVLTGRISTDNGTSGSDGTVVVFAADPRRWRENSRFVRAVRPDDDGTWKIIGLPTGDYLGVAVDYVPDGIWNDPDYLSTLRARARTVTVAATGSSSVILRLLQN
jgi:Carboxypeptidase regulatory-like domain